MRTLGPGLLIGFVLCAASIAQQPVADETQLVDRVLAVVDEDPILASEVDQVVALGLLEPASEEEDEAFRRRVLDGLIEQRLRFHEIDRYGFAEVPLEEVDDQYAAIEERLGGQAALAARLAELELDEEGLRQLLARQLMVLIYVEERLGPRVLIGLDDIQAYYDETLVPAMRERRQPVPAVAEVRERIREVLRQQRLNDEIDLWTEELRLDADIEDYFDAAHEMLPEKVVERIER